MNLGFDIDGVISDFAFTFMKIVKEKYNLLLTEKELLYHHLDLLLGINKKERRQLVKEILLEDLNLIHGAKDGILKQKAEGHEIILLTARYIELENVTKDWLKRKGIPYSNLLMLNEGKKHLADVRLDLLVEDNLEDTIGWSKKVKNILLFDHPWNKSFNVHGLFKRVYSWKDILDEIKLLED